MSNVSFIFSWQFKSKFWLHENERIFLICAVFFVFTGFLVFFGALRFVTVCVVYVVVVVKCLIFFSRFSQRILDDNSVVIAAVVVVVVVQVQFILADFFPILILVFLVLVTTTNCDKRIFFRSLSLHPRFWWFETVAVNIKSLVLKIWMKILHNKTGHTTQVRMMIQLITHHRCIRIIINFRFDYCGLVYLIRCFFFLLNKRQLHKYKHTHRI